MFIYAVFIQQAIHVIFKYNGFFIKKSVLCKNYIWGHLITLDNLLLLIIGFNSITIESS
jgi:hypothetical protein